MGLTSILRKTANFMEQRAARREERQHQKASQQVIQAIEAYFTYSDALNQYAENELDRFERRPGKVKALFPELQSHVFHGSTRESLQKTEPMTKDLVQLLEAIPLHTLPAYDAETFNTETEGDALRRRANERVKQVEFDEVAANEAVDVASGILEQFDHDAEDVDESALTDLMNRYLNSDRNAFISRVEDFGGFIQREINHADTTVKWAKTLDSQFHDKYKTQVTKAAKQYKKDLKRIAGFNTGGSVTDFVLDHTIGMLWKPKRKGPVDVDLTEDLEETMRTYIEQRTRQSLGEIPSEEQRRGSRSKRNLAALALLAGAAGTAGYIASQNGCSIPGYEAEDAAPTISVQPIERTLSNEPGLPSVVPPAPGDTYQAQEGQGFYAIAEQHLGADASEEDVRGLVKDMLAAEENADLVERMRDTMITGGVEGRDSLPDVALPVDTEVYVPN